MEKRTSLFLSGLVLTSSLKTWEIELIELHTSITLRCKVPLTPCTLILFSPRLCSCWSSSLCPWILFYILSFLSLGFIRVLTVTFEFPYLGLWSLPLSSLMVQWFFSIFPYTRNTYLYFSSKGFSILSGGPTFSFVIFWLISLYNNTLV